MPMNPELCKIKLANQTYLLKDIIARGLVKANPTVDADGHLTKIEIDGITYDLTEVSGTILNGKWTTLTINGTTAGIPQGGGQGGAEYTSGAGIVVDNAYYTISIDEEVVAKKEDVPESIEDFEDAPTYIDQRIHDWIYANCPFAEESDF